VVAGFVEGPALSGRAGRLYRDRVVAAFVANEVCRLLVLRAKQAQGQQGPGAFAPVVKVVRNMVDQRIADLVVDLLGPEGTLGGDYEWQLRDDAPRSDALLEIPGVHHWWWYRSGHAEPDWRTTSRPAWGAAGRQDRPVD
jgi:hypothetical protein